MIKILPLNFIGKTLLQLLTTNDCLYFALLARFGFNGCIKDALLFVCHPSRCFLSEFFALGGKEQIRETLALQVKALTRCHRHSAI